MDKNEDKLFNKAFSLALFYLKFRPRTEREMVLYLKKKSKRFKFDDKIIEKVIRKLKKANYINDKEFARWFIEEHLQLNPKGVFLLKLELRRLGVGKEIVEEEIEAMNIDEEKVARELLESRKERFLRETDRKKGFKKAIEFLRRRGFSSGASYSAASSVLNFSLNGDEGRSKILR